ncbi:hypothetical protein BDF20DRAFT_826697 [Mycotypha africana]|uniref:uncharacterized protein n=1 Tax=Mycotypha africana TaxID=64632 RepID=UPI0023016FB8|nr:uncharacterized protein BDF20DRAFT_826697 [Mycotypha africana]KAI8968916.1 hypothetical protein BDF20DRAFT_826697 [Mycotypha africana]
MQYEYAPKAQNEDLPMDLGELQDIFSFEFMGGRPILNFILAVLWSIGLPVLIYNILKPHLGQVVSMVIASAPPLAIVITRMVRDHSFDPLGCVAGVSFLISGILSIAQPNERVSAVCEGLVSLFVGVSCIISILPITIGNHTFKPLVFQLATQVMPRPSDDEDLQKHDDSRLTSAVSSSSKDKDQQPQHLQSKGRSGLEFLYNNMAKFRHDMRFMTATWGVLLIAAYIIKVIIVFTSTSMWKAQWAGFILFGLATFFMGIFTWFYTKIVKGNVLKQIQVWKRNEEEQKVQRMDARTEAVHNVNWGLNSMSNVFSQIAGSPI